MDNLFDITYYRSFIIIQTKNKATKYSKEFRESMVSLRQTSRSANSLSNEYKMSVSNVSK